MASRLRPLDALVEDVCAMAASALPRPRPAPVINATGVVLHTNLGRAPLSAAAAEAVARVASSYSDLELDLKEGRTRFAAGPRLRASCAT